METVRQSREPYRFVVACLDQSDRSTSTDFPVQFSNDFRLFILVGSDFYPNFISFQGKLNLTESQQVLRLYEIVQV